MATIRPQSPKSWTGFVAYTPAGWPASWTASFSAKSARKEAVSSLSTEREPVTWADLLKRGWRVRKMIISPVQK